MRNIRRLSAVALVLLTLGPAACDRPTAPTAPAGRAREGLFDDLGGYTLVMSGSTQSTATVSAVLGSAGGTLAVNGHTLQVPAGALTQPTRFTMGTVSGTSIRVSLSAQDPQTGAPVTVFPSPLRLSLSYASAKVSNPNRLKVAWVVGGVIVAVQPSELDKSHKLVSSWLYHFTDFGIAS